MQLHHWNLVLIKMYRFFPEVMTKKIPHLQSGLSASPVQQKKRTGLVHRFFLVPVIFSPYNCCTEAATWKTYSWGKHVYYALFLTNCVLLY